MSSFICSYNQFNAIEASIKMLFYSNNFSFPYSLKQHFPILYSHRDKSDRLINGEISKVIDTLRELNVVCVTLQYKDHFQGTLDAEIQEQKEFLLSNKKVSVTLSKIELFKALRCVGYQIEKEHLAELRDLTESEENALLFVKEFSNHLAYQIVTDLPAYEKAAWSID